MSRTLSFEYNAALALDELVVDRFVGADYDEMRLTDSFSHTFDYPMAAGTAHILFARPHIEFDATRPRRNAVLRLPEVQLVVFFSRSPEGFELAYRFTVIVGIEFSLERDLSTGNLRPNFAGITTEDVSVTYVRLDPDEDPRKEDLIEVLMPSFVVEALGGGRLGGISVPLNIDEDFMYADSADIRVYNDDSLADKDTLNLAFYESDDDTRGVPDDITNFMVDGTTLTFRLSQSVFAMMVDCLLNNRFMNFEMQVAGEEFTENSIRLSAPDDSGRVTITGRPTPLHASVSGRIENSTRGDSVSLNTDNNGAFEVTLAAAVGDTLTFSGDYFTDRSTGTAFRVYYPTIGLRDGSISLSGSAWVDKLGGMDVTFDGEVYLRLDPVSGLPVPSTNVDLDLPCKAECVEFLLSIFIGPFANLFFGYFEEDLETGITAFFANSGLSFIPGFNDPDRIAIFLENIEILSDGIIVSGQIEAGWLYNAGRTTEDRLDMGDRSALVLNSESATVSVLNGQMCRVVGLTFEQLGPEEIPEAGHRYSNSLTFDSQADLNGRVFAIVTEANRLAKVRIDVFDGVGPIMRWVTYNSPIEPRVEIVGEWLNDGEWGSDGRWRWGGAEYYWGYFTLEYTRLHVDGPLEIVWDYTYEIYGHEGDPPAGFIYFAPWYRNDRQYLTICTRGLAEGAVVWITVTVTVTDVFGRSATATRRVSAQPIYREMEMSPPPQWRGEWFDPHIPYRKWAQSLDEQIWEMGNKPDKQESREKMVKLRDELLGMAQAVDASMSASASQSVSSAQRRRRVMSRK